MNLSLLCSYGWLFRFYWETPPYFSVTGHPLVNIQEANWKITMLSIGKSTIYFYGHFQ
jgi:hypothetical protein